MHLKESTGTSYPLNLENKRKGSFLVEKTHEEEKG